MSKKEEIKKKVLEKLSKTHVDMSLKEPIKVLVTELKTKTEESSIKDLILKFFKDRDLKTEKQAYVLETLVHPHDVQLVSDIHKKVLKNLIDHNCFVKITF